MSGVSFFCKEKYKGCQESRNKVDKRCKTGPLGKPTAVWAYLNSSGITSKASIFIRIPQRPLVTESLDELVALISGDEAPSIILSFDWSKYKSSSLIDSSSGDKAKLSRLYHVTPHVTPKLTFITKNNNTVYM